MADGYRKTLERELRQDCYEIDEGDHSEGLCIFYRAAAQLEADGRRIAELEEWWWV